jgi:hypothetical protein
MLNRQLLFLAVAASATVTPVIEASAQSVVVSTERAGVAGGRSYHVAEDGDTLFGLAQRFLGDSLSWPLLWSYNPQITNPHWIYPGDIVFTAPEANADSLASMFENVSGRVVPLGGFYTSEEVEVLGQLRFANTGRRFIAEYDTVYLSFEDRDEVVVGDSYALNRVVGTIEDEDGNLVGVRYAVMGVVQVVAENEETELYTGFVTEMRDAIERGESLFLSEPQVLDVAPRANEVTLETEIYDLFRGGTLIHQQDLIFIAVGSEDGVQVGNRLRVWDRQDEGANFDVQLARRERQRRNTNVANQSVFLDERGRPLSYEQVQEQLPWQPAGEAMVIYTTEHYATALITRAGSRELRLGQRLTMEEGD